METKYNFCPVCRIEGYNMRCGHMLPRAFDRATFLTALRPIAKTPLDMGVSRFAADVLELLSA